MIRTEASSLRWAGLFYDTVREMYIPPCGGHDQVGGERGMAGCPYLYKMC